MLSQFIISQFICISVSLFFSVKFIFLNYSTTLVSSTHLSLAFFLGATKIHLHHARKKKLKFICFHNVTGKLTFCQFCFFCFCIFLHLFVFFVCICFFLFLCLRLPSGLHCLPSKYSHSPPLTRIHSALVIDSASRRLNCHFFYGFVKVFFFLFSLSIFHSLFNILYFIVLFCYHFSLTKVNYFNVTGILQSFFLYLIV